VSASGWRSDGFVAASVPAAYERFMRRQLFEPWARDLVARAKLRVGMSVLDVASGPGTVAHLAAASVGTEGRVLATDVSPAMLELAASPELAGDAARVECLQCPASALDVVDASFQRVLCQQGLQFFPDRLGALREMHRALEDGGALLVATWARERPLGLFGPIDAAMLDCGVSEPYPQAFDADTYTVAAEDLRELLEAAEFAEVSVETVELECVWESSDELLATVFGTPFGPLVGALAPAYQERLRASLLEHFGFPGGGAVAIRTASNVGRAVK
jgi:ubiquinone/menaquinone biosynthesis C-methylase UbiE